MQSKYCYEGTNILINNKGLRSEAQLEEYETFKTLQKLSLLADNHNKFLDANGNAYKNKLDFAFFSRIHRFLFEDIYPFAGEMREEDISKDGFSFAQVLHLENAASILFSELKKEKYLTGKTKEELPERLAYYMSELLVLHPFREGNGRAIREFIRCLAINNGFNIEWKNINKDVLFRASVKSIADTSDLEDVIKKNLVKKTK